MWEFKGKTKDYRDSKITAHYKGALTALIRRNHKDDPEFAAEAAEAARMMEPDHINELQTGGPDAWRNPRMLDRFTNRDTGWHQIRPQIRDLPDGHPSESTSSGGQMTSANPGPSRLIATVEALRSALVESPDVFRFTLGGTIDEETAAEAETDGVPREFLAFCRVLDGASCGPSVQLFGLEEAEEHQFYCEPVVDSPLSLSPEKLFCIGLINQAAVFLDRAGGGVLGALEEGADWVDAEHFDQLAPSLETFFLERLATPAEYQRLALVDDELVEYDDWLKLLRRAGLAD